MLKAVLDTNVFISGLLKSPTNRKVLTAIRKNRFKLILSPDILSEFIGVLSRPKFRHIITRETAENLLEILKVQAIMVEPISRINAITEDPSDNRFIEAAIAGRASFIVSGDNHLFKLKKCETIRIISPKEFLSVLEKA